MSQPDVKRWQLKGFIPGVEGESKAVFRPIVVLVDDFDRIAAERDALQLRLNAADQRIDELMSALTRIHGRCEAFADDERDMRVTSVEVMRDIAYRALGQNPAESEQDQGIPGTSFRRLNMLANQGE
ncbi:hypothetical protein [Pseudomonas sp. GM78]|uniref:hypothetical protein n=1 Tax=Pseudomonas sp. GM78 TaxID=1144337 RepID=UPI0012FBA0A8|nr:hypothetical protein [Pseudomonas sp. GM78]